MKFDIGNKIKKHRRDASLTQEAFAEKLGVSEQAVSRWECGTAYPDVELLPVIARMFGVTVDHLFGMPDSERAWQAEELSKRLSTETWKEVPDTGRIIEMLREIRRFHMDCNDHRWIWWCRCSVLGAPEILPEARLAIEDVLESNPNYGEEVIRQNAIITLAKIEDEEHIAELLKKYAAYSDISRSALLQCRFEQRGEGEKLRAAREWALFHTVNELLENTFSPCGNSPEECLQDNDFLLEILHLFCDLNYDAAHPIRGQGKNCAWAEKRINIGMKRAAFLAAAGETEGAFCILEETVLLIEDLMKAEPDSEIRTMSSRMTGVTLRSNVVWEKIDENRETRCVHFWAYDPYKDVTDRTDRISPHNIVHTLINSDRFAPIRDDQRFGDCIGRLKMLTEIRLAQNK